MSPDTSERRALFHAGQRQIFPILPGSAAWAMISGVAMVKGGLPAGWAIAMSFLVYGASAQLAALPLIVAGAPLWVIIATGFITNLRFVIYSAAMRPYFAHESARKRALLGFFMTDFGFTLFMRAAQENRLPDRHRDAWFAGMAVTTWFTWQTFTCIGVIAASQIPTDWGLEFTGTIALVALAGPALNTRPAVVGGFVAAVVALLAHGLPFKLGLFCGALAGIAVATVVASLNKPPALNAQGAT